MTTIIRSGPRHYWVRGSTLTGWRPQPGEWARLVEIRGESPQAAIGDVVEVTRCRSGPMGIIPLWLDHRGGSNLVPDEPNRRGRRSTGTVGHWEHCVPVVLSVNGSTLAQLSSEDRVAVLVAAVRELSEEERFAFSKQLISEDFKMSDKQFRAETWVLACDQEGDEVIPAGWPASYAKAGPMTDES